jgi:hypothetical protein
MTISTYWNPTLQGMDFKSSEAFREFLKTIDFEKLSHTAAAVRGVDRSSPKINPNVYERGALNVIFEILFTDGVSWAARLSLPQEACFPESNQPEDEFLRRRKYISKSEVDTQRYVRENTSIPIPEIFHSDLSYDGGGVGAPYIMMEGIAGQRLRVEFPFLPPHIQDKVFRQVAHVVIQLSNLTFPKIGLLRKTEDDKIVPVEWYDGSGFRHPPCRTSSSYYKRVYGLMRARTLSNPDPDVKAMAWMWDRCSIHLRTTFGTSGPFPLCHGDLWSGNFLWNENLNLVAVIDWTNTMAMPWETSALIRELFLYTLPGGVLARERFANILATEEHRFGCVRRVSELFFSKEMQILSIIKDVNMDVAMGSFRVPRLISLMPEATDVTFLDFISPNYIERCTRYRTNLKGGIASNWVSYKDIVCWRREVSGD